MLEQSSDQTTGRYLVLLREDTVEQSVAALADVAGIRSAYASDFTDGAVNLAEIADSEGVVLPDIGVAVVNALPDQQSALTAAVENNSAIMTVEPERIVYAIVTVSDEYLRGYRDAIVNLTDGILGGAKSAPPESAASAQFVDDNVSTWGLKATRVIGSAATGRGIKVAVLDTGFDFDHPDFASRPITRQSFISGQPVQDGNGHGTHCIGTVGGPLQPGIPPRYGVAPEAEIFAGKVLSNQGSGGDAGILAGIQWALTGGCQVVSMSLEARLTTPNQAFSTVFEAAARRALTRGLLIIAAAGNDSRRDLGRVAAVGHPANCPSIMAVGAVDASLQIAYFSNAGPNSNGGQVDIVGPGVDVRSSWLMPRRYNTISGTSMATPHLAGIAALHAQVSSLKGQDLWNRLTQTARALGAASDYGKGLAQAP